MKAAKRLPIMMYHHVTPNGGMINSTPQNFESQLQWLKNNGWQSVTTQQVEEFLAGQPIPAKSVLLTFDDGYLDNWVYAYPLLKKYGFTAVCFLVTSWIQDGELRPNTLNVTTDFLPECPEHHECERLIEAGRSDDVVLRWNEIQAMRETGVFEFHSHTHTHTRWDLSKESAHKNERILWELQTAQAILQTKLGIRSEHFCWPQGYYDDDYIRIAQKCGYQYLYTTDAFGFNLPSTPASQLHRFAVRNTRGRSIGKRLKLAVSPISGSIFNWWKRSKQLRRARKAAREARSM
ncbi:MAG TPA: polysaccharide deacetylase family protein [Candidatus Paenalcaligenes intestinipullorum]|uniref:Polysaccharide deacetylase family protein n=1 Tax=Candidatus Paenalcaligenes intestinipullorum TaxID=2838718 RepID=A0A9D2RFG4_9BURK|nr:polysaccharide deacetylase family protein [Candidatus Paenalcaligenes intestinipullorum]